MIKEIWRTLPRNDNYEISTWGNIRRAKNLGLGGRLRRGGKLTPVKVKGYLTFGWLIDGKKKHFKVHRLVLEAFIGECPNGFECNHKDGNKTDNRLENLEWVTRSENHRHAYRIKLRESLVGEKHGQVKLNENNVVEIRKLRKDGWRQKDISTKFNITQQHVSDIILDKTWKHIKNLRESGYVQHR